MIHAIAGVAGWFVVYHILVKRRGWTDLQYLGMGLAVFLLVFALS